MFNIWIRTQSRLCRPSQYITCGTGAGTARVRLKPVTPHGSRNPPVPAAAPCGHLDAAVKLLRSPLVEEMNPEAGTSRSRTVLMRYILQQSLTQWQQDTLHFRIFTKVCKSDHRYQLKIRLWQSFLSSVVLPFSNLWQNKADAVLNLSSDTGWEVYEVWP